jgi:sigma-B regulation protein RsbU (phosphoserine phosphatase)
LLDIQTGKFVYVNAGHNPPLIYRHKTQQFSYIEVKRNFVLGGMDELDYQAQEMMLEPDDKLFFYTDGVTEALNEAEELYGEERLLTCLNEAGAEQLDLKGLLTAVQKSLAAHVGEAEQSDDITMMVLDYQGKQTGEV